MRMYQLIFWHAVYQCEIVASKLSRLRSEEEAYDYAEFWLLTNPEDIVMLVEVEVDICTNCDLPIQENPGWALYRWIHINTRAFTCQNKLLTKAAPKEDECKPDGMS